jgi:hypothetical protein
MSTNNRVKYKFYTINNIYIRNIIILIFCLFLFLPCSSKNDILKLKKEIVFNVGMPIKSCGTFYENDSMYFYFAELASRKQIKIYNSNTDLVKTISLKKFNYLDMAENIYMPCMDSIILVIGNPVQLVYLIDDNANILYQRVFPQFVNTDSITYALDASFLDYSACIYNNNNSIYLLLNAFRYLDTSIHLKEYVECNRIANNSPLFYNVSLNKKDSMITYIGNNLLPIVYPNDTIFRVHYPYFKIDNDYLFNFIYEFGKIMIIDTRTKKYIKTIQIKSRYAKIGIDVINFTDKNKDSQWDKIGESWRVQNIVWDKFKQCYYIFITKGAYNNDVIIQRLDANFHLVAEKKMINNNNLRFTNVVVIKDGLLINIYNEKNTNNAIYKLYSVNF